MKIRRGNGESIGFVGGPYIGKTGWIDNTGNVTANSIGVIVHNVKKPIKDDAAERGKTQVVKKEVEEDEEGFEALSMGKTGWRDL